MVRAAHHFAWILCFPACSLVAQLPTKSNEKTAVLAEARFEIVQSAFSAKYTFRVDKFTGETWQLVLQQDSSATWQPIAKTVHPLSDTKSPGRANYQLFSSGIAVRYTFLINVNTGSTWQLMEDPTEGAFWSALYPKAPK
jgi:hypothetical protein